MPPLSLLSRWGKPILKHLKSPSLLLFFAILAAFSFVIRLLEVKFHRVGIGVNVGIDNGGRSSTGIKIEPPRQSLSQRRQVDKERPASSAALPEQRNPFLSQIANDRAMGASNPAVPKSKPPPHYQAPTTRPSPLPTSNASALSMVTVTETNPLAQSRGGTSTSTNTSISTSTSTSTSKRKRYVLGPNEYEYDIEINGKQGQSSTSPLKECESFVKRFHVEPERSWGSMRQHSDRNRWQALECNTVLKRRAEVTCTELHGKRLLENWRKNRMPLCSSKEHYCYASDRDNYQCSFSGMRIDFTNSPEFNYARLEDIANKYRSANPHDTTIRDVYDPHQLDLLTTKQVAKAALYNGNGNFPSVAGFPNGFFSSTCNESMPSHNDLLSTFNKYFPSFRFNRANGRQCDAYVDEPVLIVSHDCMTNMGHLFQDILNWWLVAELQNVPLKSLTVVNIDGLRPATVLQGPGRHILNAMYPDSFGPFRQIHEVLFGRLVSASAEWHPLVHKNGTKEAGKNVCFRNKVFTYPMPLKGFLWDKFEVEDPCSYKLQPSYIYRKFTVEYMRSWRKFGDLEKHRQSLASKVQAYPSVNTASGNVMKLLLITRKSVTSGMTVEILGRAYANFDEVVNSLRKYVDGHPSQRVTLITADFSDMPFAEQVALANSVDVLIGFHGAGINHMFHMDPNRPNCCGVVEIFPQSEGCNHDHGQLCNYYRRIGHGNHCRFLGYSYKTLMAHPNSFIKDRGTSVNTHDLVRVVNEIVSPLL